MMNDGQHWFGGGFMWIFWILLILAVIWAVSSISSNNPNSSPPSDKQKTSMDILKERYARGDINQHEFEQKKKDLQE